MKSEFTWLGLILVQTALMWVPYILNLFYKQGILGAMNYYDPKNPPLSDWAMKAKAAHSNAVENLALLAPATLLYLLINRDGPSNDTVLLCLQVYFFARIAHYISYSLKFNFVRTVFFLTGWVSTLIILCKVLCPN
jgi:uncharacterized MAPEG superfamily protein